MAEREALKREIEELQNLIMDHKRVHGDCQPSSAHCFSSRCGQGRGRGHNLCYIQSYSGQQQPYSCRPSSHWRKTYSLNNKTTGAHGKADSHFSDPNKTQQARLVASDTCSFMQNRKLTGIDKRPEEAQNFKDSTAPSHNTSGNVSYPGNNKLPVSSGNRMLLKTTRAKSGNVGTSKSASSVASRQFGLERIIKPYTASQSASDMAGYKDTLSVSSSEETSAFRKRETVAQPQMKSHVAGSLTNRTVIMPTSDSSAQPIALLACPSPASNLRPKPSAAPQVSATCSSHKKSRFTWVKCEGVGDSQPKPAIRPTMHSPSSSSASAAPAGFTNIKQVNASNKKPHRRPGLCSGTPKTSTYSWVSASCSKATVTKAASSAKPPHKQPKTLKMPCKVGKEVLGGAKKFAFTPPVTPKRAKAGGSTSTSQVNQASRYRWKAAVQSPSVGVCTSTSRFSRKASVYRWTAQKQDRDPSPGLLPSRVQQSPPTTPLSGGGAKPRSRTMLVRKCSSGSLTPERRTSLSVVTVRSRYSLRRRTHTPVKPPTSGRRGQARALVSYGRHKLRLSSSSPTPSSWSPRTGSFSLSARSPAYLRGIKTRYKIDTRRTHLQHHNPALSYRLKRIQSARILLQSRVRTPPDRQWRGRGMRWIGGALYRVSANKLSRTHTTTTPSYRSAKWFNPQAVSSPSSVGRTSSTRHVASRAVQRSLAIIRHARQKKQQARQYCMYYNRFGKCNRGDACPYIHDPEKVAVCTRFLRGTCKQTDGTCPFSHKVSREKMPVCSYYLKGICNNSSCPYSHVYVSRKAAVCQDFIRGYCPQGEKCKKKHTLVCPEFSSTGTCPRGSQCKLQHRQRGKRPGPSPSGGLAKKPRTRDTAKRTDAGSAEATRTGESSDPDKLPSFISLSSSPDPPESAASPSACPPAAGQEVTGKKLHIKPRFSSLS